MKLSILAVVCLALSVMSFRNVDTTITQPSHSHFFHPWELLGVKQVNYSLDRDDIKVTASEGFFTAIKIKVKRAPVNLHKLVVHYGNGDVEEIELRQNFPAGSESRVLDLPGNKRVIQKVVFWYDTKNLARRKGIVELWGRH